MAITTYGKDYLTYIEFPHLENAVSFNYWDLWISIVIENKCDGDFNKLKAALKTKSIEGYSYRNSYEEILSQLAYYQERLEKYELTPQEIMKSIAKKESDPDFLKKQEKRAVKKILSLDYSPKDKTVAMENTPRKVKTRTGIEGTLESFWDGIETEAMPYDYREIFLKKFKESGFYTKGQTFALEKKLRKNLDKLTKKATIYQLFAIYRCFLTIVIQKTEQIDDSYGEIGHLAQDIFSKYIELDRTVLATAPEEFYTDILNLMLWEDYGYFDKCYESFFKQLPTEDIEIVESILLQEQQELKQLEFDYHEEEALSLLAHLYAQHQLFHKFVGLTEKLGTRKWGPTSLLANMALKHDKKEVALAVYEAALKGKKSFHRKTILEKYEALKS